MTSSELVSGTSAIAAAAVAWIAWMQLSRDVESRHVSRAAARRAAAPIVLRMNRALEELLGVESSLIRARLYLDRHRAELERAYVELVPITGSLSERDAMAVLRAGARLESAGVVLAGYAVDQGIAGPMDRLHLAAVDLEAAKDDLESLLDPSLKALRQGLRGRPGWIEEFARSIESEARDSTR